MFENNPDSPKDTQTQTPQITWVPYTLKSEDELRFEIDKEAKIKLADGTAEYFGTELALNREYTLNNVKGAIFSWKGCKIEVTDNVKAYISNGTPMLSYANIHSIMDQHRMSILSQKNQQGPRVLIAGPTDVGKSTLAKILMGYSARLGYNPAFIDLDPGQGSITLPGALCASLIDRPVDIEEGLSNTVPFVQYYGHTSLDINPTLFKAQIQSLGISVDKRMEQSDNARVSGMIVNTCGWIEGLGYELLRESINLLRINIIVVIDNEKLYSDLSREFSSGGGNNSSSGMKVMKLPKSGGVYLRSALFRKQTRMQRIREYFYGIQGDLCPHITIVDFKDVCIFRTGGGPPAPSTALPIGSTSVIDPLALQEIQPSPEMLHSVLAISYAKNSQSLLRSNVAGFLYVSDINMETKKISFLAPCPGDLPSKFLLMGTLKWLE
ncbi:pre-mRNA cleavage complex subunit [Heterostelium album PN500]|uniref:Protein CLP1 homolog n=1 Tax=Heterostelium pallidum (strain ATCC 26659 / Pp 5 / PN500) TaxID=670386 RepID=D3B2K3_HETP5|nr:pre-mRNA cleavage complex subunit [Heterostelium album PN500]EFA83551.1 pre-mRNA cleavage complex subunit [Heterostelium album PN500]|eukprot:XP_020435668.1 pre-mRNA cleavage complex subunit [Heterostelium album PN500]